MYLKKNLITFSFYFVITFIVISLMKEPTQAITVWPAVGIGIIVALVWGYKVIPALYFAELGIGLLLYPHPLETYSLLDFATSNAFIFAGIFRCYLGAFLIKYFIGYPNSLISYQSILKFFLIIGTLSTFISTILYSLIKYLLNLIELTSFRLNFLDWWSGDLLGFIIFAPFTMIFISQPKSIWRPRYLTVGLPVIFSFLSVIFIYNKTYHNDIGRTSVNLKIKSELLTTKINQQMNWMGDFSNNLPIHFSPSIDTQLDFLLDNNKNIKAIIVIQHGEDILIKLAKKNHVPTRLAVLESFDFDKLIAEKQNLLHSTHYVKELGEFINIFDLNNKSIKLIIIGNISELFGDLLSKYDLDQVEVLIDLNNNSEAIILQKRTGLLPKDEVIIQSTLNFNNENWSLLMLPTVDYFREHQPSLNNIIAKLGFLFAGLIGVMLLIITGKTTLTDIQVKERTLDLDIQTKDLKTRKKQYQTLIEQHPVILWRQNTDDNTMEYISKKVEKLFGHKLQNWLSEENFWINNIHEDDKINVVEIIEKSLQDKTPFELEYRFIKADSSIAWVKDVINIIENNNYKTQLVGLMIDVTETQEAKKRHSISEKKYRTLFKHAADPLIIINLDDNTLKDFNQKANALFGSNNIHEQMTLSHFSPTYQPDGSNSEKRLRKILRKLEENKYFNFEWIMLNNKHQEIICNIGLVKLPEQDNNIALANITDITEKKLHEKKINQLAYYDNLTKLPNREYFYSKFEYFHKLAIEKKMYGTIIYLDLDRFKILNDSLGHQAGDELLKMVAQRIRKVSRKHDFCARLGGDEFVILTKKVKSSIETTLETSLVKSELILEALNEPYQLGDYEHHITPSIGISLFPSGVATTDQILHQADIAMYASKEKGKNTITIYQAKMIKLVSERLKIEKAIRQAFEQNEFQLHYQPQINENNEVLSVEALLRWDKLKELKINTEDLINTIEQIGLTHELGYWVFDQACAQLERWQNQGHAIKSVAVNVSAKQFHQRLFTDQIKSVIKSYNIKASQIIIELTEAVVIEDIITLVDKLNELKQYGVRISLDDFGTGYSSLAYLKYLPIDQLKIDKMFIKELSSDKATIHIVETIISLTNSMNIELIAEGIETKEQFEILKQLGCKNFQGYYFSKPKAGNKIF
ncbi:MAG: EAL domain-containing protein [Alcanivoracaceae bacterium]|nr:EAL domain-containing protein [Alcanivoracaceae bacterium]